VREGLVKFIYPKLVIDPVKPRDEHLYNAEYEHRKEVFGHKFIKDFIILQNKTLFSKSEINSWFQPSQPVEPLKHPQI
jgi:hypothetical protein